jgi:hypothetical protein
VARASKAGVQRPLSTAPVAPFAAAHNRSRLFAAILPSAYLRPSRDDVVSKTEGMKSLHEPLQAFVHIPKTAGTTLSYVMWRQFRRGEAIDLDAPTVQLARQRWDGLRPEQRERVRCVRGHMPFDPEMLAPKETRFFTVLRDPVQRIVSEYYFNLTGPKRAFYSQLIRSRMTLDQFVRSELGAQVHNAQTRMLAGGRTDLNPREVLDLAIANLRKMAMVGITERLDATLLLCRAVLGWRHVIYRRINTTRRRPSLEAISPATLATIEEANFLDRKLYVTGCERFEELLHECRITDSEVARLHRASRIYGTVRRIVGIPREVWIELYAAVERRRAEIAIERSR